MINSSALIGDLTVEEFIPVITAGVGVFCLLVLLVICIVCLLFWACSKCIDIEKKDRQRMINKIKRECVEDITKYYDDAYKRLEGDDNAEND